MANIPTPRSWSQIVGDMLDALLSRVALTTVKAGSPALAIIESAAQSDLRSSQDIFTLLNADSLDRAEGTALDRKGGDEDCPRITESASSGLVTITDSSITKISSKIFQGQAAPIAGSSQIFVLDAQSFPATGQIYVGRGTTSFEGPLTYTAKVNLGTYWRLDLHSSTKTTKFHNHNETVVVAQGGNRSIDAGSVVETAQGNISEAAKFATLYTAIVPDGEISVSNVLVVAQKPGVVGNIPAGAIRKFTSAPFTGATVTNPLPFTNARATESDKAYRERIKAVRASRSKGTDLAIKTSVLGITAADENKRVISASVVKRKGHPTTLYIDDGNGYEEQSTGIPVETLTDQALGGEQFFQVSAQRPVTKAYVATSLAAPFSLRAGMVLAVKVGGFLFKHTFNTTDFRSIGNASAYEVVASINGNSVLPFAARTISNGTQVALFAKADENEDIEVTAVDADEVDANPVLGFSAGRVDTTRLYKNDRLLSKDGQKAVIESEAQNTWAAMSGSMTLTIIVDDTPETAYTFSNTDFVNAKTGYATLSASNSLSSWATVFNKKIPGITATATAGKLTIVSNLGANARAAVKITGGTLVSAGKMFVFNTAAGLEAQGKALDYTLDRNTGQLSLEVPLVAGDRLDLGTRSTRAFIESLDIPATTLLSTAELWFVVDGGAEIVSTGVGASTLVDIAEYVATPAVTWGKRVRISATAGAPFTNISAGDWAIFLDTAFSVANRGAWRISYVDPAFTYFEIEKGVVTAQTNVSLFSGGMTFVRAEADLQKVSVAAASNYTAPTFAAAINASLRGATAEVYQTNRFRVRTNTFSNGDIALVAQNAEAQKLGLTVGDAVTNLTSHLPAVISASSEVGTPHFSESNIASVTSGTQFVTSSASGHTVDAWVQWLRNLPDTDSAVARSRYGSQAHSRSMVQALSGTAVTTRQTAVNAYLPTDRYYPAYPLSLCAKDDLTVLVDGDTDSRRYGISMFRKVKPTTNTYGITNDFTDSDNGNQSLSLGFGTGFDFRDFAVFMRARAKSHAEAGDTTKTVLWRYDRFGRDGEKVKVRYVYPTAANQAVSVTADANMVGQEGSVMVNVRLPSDAPRTGTQFRNTTKIGVMAATSGTLQSLTYILGFSISSALRLVRLAYTGESSGGFTVGDVITGATSGATGTLAVLQDAGTTGTLYMSGVTGSFMSGENLQVAASTRGVASGTQVGETTLTLNVAAAGATDHGLIVGNQVWIQSTDVNFSSGLKSITAVAAGTITYLESTTSVAATPSIGTMSFDTQGEAKISGSTVVANDIAALTAASSLPSAYERSLRISSLGGQFWKGLAETAEGVGTVPVWHALTDATALTFFPLKAATSKASDIATAVNVLAAVTDSTCPVSATAVGLAGVATGVIDRASFDEFTTPAYGYSLTDGFNVILSHTTPPDTTTNFSFTFKAGITASLATNADWQNEDLRLVPLTAKNVVDYLGTYAVSGLPSSAEVAVADEFGHMQIASRTLGSSGSIEVQGGSANSVSAAVIGAAQDLASTYAMITVKKADVEALTAPMWVEIQNSKAMPKSVFTAGTSCVSIDTSGNVVLSGTQAWTYANTAAAQINGFTWQIEQHGRYTAFRWNGVGSAPDLTGIREGDWVIVSKNATTISSRNTGQFRVVRASNGSKTFWVENLNMSPESVTADLWFLTYDSIMPGDQIAVSTSLWGAGNVGTWTVESLNSGTAFGFKLSVATKNTTAFAGPVALGTESSLVQCVESKAGKLVKQIRVISTDPSDGTLVNIKFESNHGYKNVGTAAGSIVKALDKLGFPTTLASGIDGYRHSTGLIGESARILYGDARDPSQYPGVVASGANVNISGPLVKRLTVALAVRVRSGVSVADVIDRVKSAVAAIINAKGIGEAVAISDLVSAAGSVNGVVAVTVLSPTYSAGNDLISVQPFEKPLVLNLDQDVQVSVVGQ